MNDNNAVAKQLTESERILKSFDSKLETLDKLSSAIIISISNIVGFEAEGKEEALKDVSPVHFISELDVRLSRLQILIDNFADINANLSRLV